MLTKARRLERLALHGLHGTHSWELLEQSTQRAEEIRESLGYPRFRECNEAFVEKKGRRSVEPEWYKVPPDDVPSLFRMAEALDRAAEYQSLTGRGRPGDFTGVGPTGRC